MRFEASNDSDVAYLYLVDDIKPREVTRTVAIQDASDRYSAITLDFDADDALLGIEFLSKESFARIVKDLSALT